MRRAARSVDLPRRGWSMQIDPGEAVLQVRARGPELSAVELSALRLEIEPEGAARPVALPLSLSNPGVCAAIEYSRLNSGRATVRPPRPRRCGTAGRGPPSIWPSVGNPTTGWPWRTAASHSVTRMAAVSSTWVPSPVHAGGDWPKRPRGTARVPRSLAGGGIGAFREGLEIAVRLPAETDPDRVALYQTDGGSWTLLGTELVEATDDDGAVARYLRGELDGLGTVAVLRDTDPPYLGRFMATGQDLEGVLPLVSPRASRDKNGVTLPRWPRLELPLVDFGAGITSDGIAVRLDDRPFPARWDPEEERLFFEFHRDPGEGAHRIDVEVTDEVGNIARKSLSFELREL